MIKALACICSLLAMTGSSYAADKPNILFIAVDDMRPVLGTYGVNVVHSPNLDRLATTGIRFDRAYCQYAICGPTRASLLTGLRPDTLKIDDIDTFFRSTVPDIITLPQYFKQHGYETVYVGKVFHPGQEDNANSWTRHIPVPGESGPEYKLPESLAIIKQRRADGIAKYGKQSKLEGLTAGPAWEAADAPDSSYMDGQVADGAITALRELKKDQPFFLGVGFHKPHLPFVAPKKNFDLYDPATLPLTDTPNPPSFAPNLARHSSFELRTRCGVPESGPIDDATQRKLLQAYYACVSFVDAQIGRVLDELDKEGLRDNTIIVVWGDHGWHLGEYGIWGKATDYEVATRVPLIVCAPQATAHGQGSKALVEFVDIYPTLCELAGLQVPPQLPGRSFVPLLSHPDLPWKEAAFSQFPTPALREWAARPLTTEMRQTFFGPLIAQVEQKLRQENGDRYNQDIFENYVMGYSMRTDRYRLTIWVDRRTPEEKPYAIELYDHEIDPRESVNVAGTQENAALVENLRQQLLAALRKTPYKPSASPVKRRVRSAEEEEIE